MEPYEHDFWRREVVTRYPHAYFQDDSTPSGFRERALDRGHVAGFFMRPHATGLGSGYVIPLKVENECPQ